MKALTISLYLRVKCLTEALREEHGQDLIEYLLIGGIVALGATAGMGNLATNLNTAFASLGTKAAAYIT